MGSSAPSSSPRSHAKPTGSLRSVSLGRFPTAKPGKTYIADEQSAGADKAVCGCSCLDVYAQLQPDDTDRETY